MPRLVFAGAGHGNLAALRRLARRPPGRMVLVNASRFAWYTGALPGLIRGDIPLARARIDVAALAVRCGAEFIEARIEGFDAQALRLEGCAALGFDYLALSIGGAALPGGVKPIQELLERVAQLEALPSPRVGLLGAGAAGVELALALRRRFGPRAEIFVAGAQILPGAPAAARRAAAFALLAANITLVPALPAPLDDIIHAYTPEPALSIGADLRVIGHDHIFATGDCARLPLPAPRSGAIAVRQGRVLAQNLRRAINQARLKPFHTPRATLAILSLDNSTALAWYGRFIWQGRWPSRIKTWLDEGWVS